MNIEIAETGSSDGTSTIPRQMTSGSSGFDLIASVGAFIQPQETRLIPTGIALSIPRGYEGQVRSRSGLASRGLVVANAPGTIDSDYRGEVFALMLNQSDEVWDISPGDRIAQLVFAPVCVDVTLKEVLYDDIDRTDRQSGSLMSTGLSDPPAGSGC